jgi:hypothetical protein
MWLVKLIKFIAPKSVVNTTEIGLAMINLSIGSFDKQVLAPADILVASKGVNLRT